MIETMTSEPTAPPVPGDAAFDDDLIDYSDHEEDYISPIKSRPDSPSEPKAELVVVAGHLPEVATQTEIRKSVDLDHSHNADGAPVPAEGVTSPLVNSSTNEVEDTAKDASGAPMQADVIYKIDYDDFAVDGDYAEGTSSGLVQGAGNEDEQADSMAVAAPLSTDGRSLREWMTESQYIDVQGNIGVDAAGGGAHGTTPEAEGALRPEENEFQEAGQNDDLFVEDATLIPVVPEDEITYDEDEDDQVKDHPEPEHAQHPEADAQAEELSVPADSAHYDGRDIASPAPEDVNTITCANEQGGDNSQSPPQDQGADGTGDPAAAENGDRVPEVDDDVSSRPGRDEDIDNALDSIMQNAHENRPGVHPDDDDYYDYDDMEEEDETPPPTVTISYQGEEYPMFSSFDNLGFFCDLAVLELSMDLLLDAFRTELAEDLEPGVELSLQIDELGLEYSESTAQAHLERVTLRQLMDLHSQLIVNQSADPSRGLYAFLVTKPNPSSRLRFLLDAADAGKGLDSVAHYVQPPETEFTGMAMEHDQSDSGSEDHGDVNEHDPLKEEVKERDEEARTTAGQGGADAPGNGPLSSRHYDAAHDDNFGDNENHHLANDEDDGQVTPVGPTVSFDDDVGGVAEAAEGQKPVSPEDDREREQNLEMGADDDASAHAQGEAGGDAVTDQNPYDQQDETTADGLGQSQAGDDTDAAHQDYGHVEEEQPTLDWSADMGITTTDGHDQQPGVAPDGQYSNSDYEPEENNPIGESGDLAHATTDDDGRHSDISAGDQPAGHEPTIRSSATSSTLNGDEVNLNPEQSDDLTSFEFDENEIDWREEGELPDDALQAPQEEIKSRSPSGATKRFRVEDELSGLEDGQEAKRRRP